MVRVVSVVVATLLVLSMATVRAQTPAGATSHRWEGDLTPIRAVDWNPTLARHLLNRAGFGAWGEELEAFHALGASGAVARLVEHEDVPNPLPPFVHSGVHDPGLEPFPPSRPATTRLAKTTGQALGVKVKPSGNRRLQPVVNRFFYWLRASRLETDRLAYWWANRMLTTRRPLQEKMALFWHGHFPINESKVRDYRKHLQLLEVFHEHGTANFRDLLIAVAKSPGMLAFLDAGVNIKGSPNENFAREIMELFTMGVGRYRERDIREAARAFTGWYFNDLRFVINASKHDEGSKTFLGHSGPFDGIQIIDLILAEPGTAEFVASKIYRYFVRDRVSPQTIAALGRVLRKYDYDLKPLLETIFLSRDFYSTATRSSRIKEPVEFVVSTLKGLGLKTVPGVPDFNQATNALGQRLFHPPTVAGWPQGRSWITPGLLIARGNFARAVLFPDINFIPNDRYPTDPLIRGVSRRIALGYDISTATIPEGKGGNLSMSNMMADRDEDFNTRYGSYKGWQMALQRVKPIVRDTAPVALWDTVAGAGVTSTREAVDFLAAHLLSVPVMADYRTLLVQILTEELGTEELARAATYAEEPLRRIAHLLMSSPEYQFN